MIQTNSWLMLTLAVLSVAVTVTTLGLDVSALLESVPEITPVLLLMLNPEGNPEAENVKALLAESAAVRDRLTDALSWLI
jgi:hypothetical protein